MSFQLYVCDTETTGLDKNKNDIIEICFWRLNDDVSKTWCLKPLNIEAIEDRALAVNKHKREDLIHKTAFGRETYLEPAKVVADIEMWMLEDNAPTEDRIFIGQNPLFDFEFLLELWKKTDNESTFPFSSSHNRPIIDTIQLALLIDICTGKKRKYYNLGSLIKDFGVTKAQAHRADGDVKMTRDLFLKMITPIRQAILEAHKDNYYVAE